MTKKVKEISSKVIFADERSKELFIETISTFSNDIKGAMANLALHKEYGATEPKISVIGDEEIHVTLIPRDKGIVLSKDGYVEYSSLEPGDKYGQVDSFRGQSGLVLFIKSGEGRADIPKGFAPSVREIYDEFNGEDLDVEKVSAVKIK